MTALDLFAPAPEPTGLNPYLDGPRLDTLRERIRVLMLDGAWRTLAEIQAACGGSEAGCSAKLRDLRKRPYLLTVAKQRRGEPASGCWEYRVNG